MRILVAGAGIGGLAAARALLADGHEVVVYERADRLRTGGAAVTLWSNGTGVLRDLGVSLDDTGNRIDRLEQRGFDGRVLARIDVSRSAAHYGQSNVCLPRRRLLERLAAGLPPDVVRFGRECTGASASGASDRGASDSDDGAALTFADGPADEGDLVIGADGRGSLVRDAVWGGDPATPGGWATWQGVSEIAIDVTSGTTGLMVVGPAGSAGFMPCGDGLLQWWFDVRLIPDEPMPASPVAMLRERFSHWADPVPTVLDAVSDADAGYFPHVRQAVPGTWGKGAVTLVGDAAHSMPPTRAQGANQALEDAWLLAQTLRKSASSVPEALRRYERARAPKAGYVARAAGKEDINEYRPLLTRLVPDRFASWYFTRFLGRCSNFLTARAGSGREAA
jgi:FAD-dependent urate hydroxylase